VEKRRRHRGKPQLGSDDLSRKQLVEFVVRADPNPFNRVAGAHTHRPILFSNADGPDVAAPLQFLETQRRMLRLAGKS
jgi:hypothetical protein